MTDKKPSHNFDQLSEALLEGLNQKSYGIKTKGNYRRALSRISKFMVREGVSRYIPEVGDAFVADLISRTKISKSHIRFTKTVVRRLNDVEAGIDYRLVEQKPTPLLPSQYSELLESFLGHCAKSGNKENTIAWKRRNCGSFLRFLSDLGCCGIHEINADYICRVIVRFTNKDAYALIRAFLRYLHETDAVRVDYSGIIPKHSRGRVLPTTYTTDEVRRLESAVNRATKVGKRDYAILLLATRLGIRSGDIVSLTYECIDFDRNTISLTQEKTNQPLELPLLPEIRESIDEYIRHARPSSDSDYIFLSANAPFQRMTTAAMRHSLTKCFSDADINTSGKRHGPHSLRSSLASAMVNAGTPYEVVRRLLGHSDPDAIKHYARIDIENLRRYAIDVPPPSGIFANLLEGGM